MFHDIEETLARELREVADELHVPPMPPLPESPPRPLRRRLTLLAAAAAVAVVAGATGLVATLPGDRDVQPAQPSPAPSTSPSTPPSTSPSPTAAAPAPIPDGAPAVPYVLDRGLYVDGERVPGDDWWSVRSGGDAWIGVRGMPLTWWWGRGTEVHELPNGENVTPKISPDGSYVAVVRVEDGGGILTVVDTEIGRDVEGTPTNFGPVRPEEGAYVVAVTDDGTVVVRRGNGYLTWSEDLLASTLSGEMVFDATSVGVVAGDVDGGPTYLAEISDDGTLTKVADLPEHDDLLVSPSGTWLAWTPAGTTGGDVTSVPSLQVQRFAGGEPVTLDAPDGWDFAVRTYTWEDDDHLVSVVSSTEQRQDRLARCSAEQARCVLVRAD